MSAKKGKEAVESLSKIVDNRWKVRCASGMGELREEVWADESGSEVRYNLAFIHHHLFPGDNGRVLGYDTAHGNPHRHFAGEVEEIASTSYSAVLERFILEASELKKRKKL